MKAQSQKVVNILSRTVISANGVILYEMLSSDGETKYFATYTAGGEVFCECKGFEFRGRCRHAEYIREAEATYCYDILSQAEDIVAEAEQASTHAALDAAYAARAEEMALQAAWDEFMRVPSYISRFKEGRESFEDVTYCQSCGHPSRSGMCYQCYGA